MSQGDHEEILRRALRAAADSIEPAADGLQRIRAGLRPPHVAAVAWLVVGYTSVAQPVLGRLRDTLGRLRDTLGRLRDTLGRLREATVLLGAAVSRHRLVPRQIAGPLGRLRGWVRGLFPGPGGHARRYASLQTALAVGGVVLVAAVVGVVLSGLPQKLTATGATSSAGPGGRQAVGNGRAKTNGNGKLIRTPNPTPAQQGNQGNTPGVSPTCPPSPSASASPSPSGSPTSPSPSGSPTSPSPGASTTSSPTPSTTSSPSTGSTSGTQGTGTGSTPGGTTDAMATGPFIGLAAGLAPSTPSPTATSSPSPTPSEPSSSPSPCPSGSG